MTTMKPPAKPRQTRDEVAAMLQAQGVTAKCALVGVRGYYRDTMGQPGENDRGIYDDAIFFISPAIFETFNANTDPSYSRKGKGTGAGKGMACLKPGLHWYRLGYHRGQYLALRQARPLTVVRDGNPPYEHMGWHGINIHKGSLWSTSSLGCQTIWPGQWDEFIALVGGEMLAHDQDEIPYLLIEGPTR